LPTIASSLITCPEVIHEIKDRDTRELLKTLDIAQKTPSEECMKRIIQFAKKTGDYASLSLADVKVLALTLMLEIEATGGKHLRLEPVPARVSSGPTKKAEVKPAAAIEAISPPAEEAPELMVESSPESPSKTEEPAVDPKPEDSSSKAPVEASLESLTLTDPTAAADDSDSDGGAWITPQNISRTAPSTPPKNLAVACVTNDFAMQNVLLQMKLNLVSTSGMRIKKLKSWVLRCHACYKYFTFNLEQPTNCPCSSVHHAATTH
jgi:RNA-binding protein NOB1